MIHTHGMKCHSQTFFFHSNLSLIVLKPLQKMRLKEPFDINMIKNIMQLGNPIVFLYVI